ncbi:MAG TPA: AAA family ATPase [Woeseiaceae bacterium]|jgi:putative secretion ATPase (PEP-CTERM system associated)|nr:AAA family ATPase [Woeseiaceae bacterium]
MSYLNHFKLKEQPFRLTPDPEFVYWSKQHARAKAYMESTIWLADGFVVITGEIGSGKTTLLQSFLAELTDDVVYAMVSQTQLSPSQFLQAVLTEFGFKPFKQRKVELLDMLNMFLIEQYANGKKVVLIVDEAQNLSKKVLEEIRLMSGIETHKEKVLRIILAGQPELKDTLDSPELKQLVQRVRLRFHVGPLDKREMREYIEHRLEIAGRRARDLIKDDAFEMIYRYSGGVPRLINTLCDTALLCAFTEDRTVIGLPDVRAAVQELNWKEHELSAGSYPERLSSAPQVEHPDHVTGIEVRSEGQSLGKHFFGPGRVIVGRSPDNEIYIQSKFVSRHHVQLTNDQTGCTIEDLNSTNGVYIGDERIKKYRLKDGDVVSLGIHELVYSDLRKPTAAPAGTEPELKERRG